MQRSGGQGPKEGRILAHSRRIMWQEHKEWGAKEEEVKDKGRVTSCRT